MSEFKDCSGCPVFEGYKEDLIDSEHMIEELYSMIPKLMQLSEETDASCTDMDLKTLATALYGWHEDNEETSKAADEYVANLSLGDQVVMLRQHAASLLVSIETKINSNTEQWTLFQSSCTEPVKIKKYLVAGETNFHCTSRALWLGRIIGKPLF